MQIHTIKKNHCYPQHCYHNIATLQYLGSQVSQRPRLSSAQGSEVDIAKAWEAP